MLGGIVACFVGGCECAEGMGDGKGEVVVSFNLGVRHAAGGFRERHVMTQV